MQTLYSFANNYDIQKDLDRLNTYIDNQDTYRKQKEERIFFLKKSSQNPNLSLLEQYSRAFLLYEEYSTYKYDSMYVYAERMNSLATKINDKDLIVKSQLSIANTLLWGGLFKDASEYFNEIDIVNTDKQTQLEYWNTYFSISFESALYARYNSILFYKYKTQMENIIKQIEKIDPKNSGLIINRKFELAFHDKENSKALEYGLALKDTLYLKDSLSTYYSELLGNIGYNYIDIGDTIQGMRFMIESAIISIKQGSTRYSAMRKIAEATYGKGDLEDAYKYIQLSMSNAKFFGSRYRIYEASKILPKVDSDLNEKLQDQKTKITNLLLISIVAVIVLAVTIFLYIKRNKKLKVVKQQLNDQNNKLTEQNNKINQIINELSEANKIKEAGIRQLFNSNIELYNNLDIFLKGIQRKIQARQINDLNIFVSSSNLFKTKDKIAEDFDQMFLQLFPDFVKQFNSLLKPEYQIVIEGPKSLTPELRIFALIRIGFSKNETIAKLLNYSVSTVKNYKTKIKNNSMIPNDEFEAHLMHL